MVVRETRFGLHSDMDVLAARREVQRWARELGLSVLDCTKIATAASELARNTVVHGHGGSMSLEVIRDGVRDGIRAAFADRGPGIPDLERAMTDGYSTGGSMGMGLPGARRLVNEFAVRSTAEGGTVVTIVRWKA